MNTLAASAHDVSKVSVTMEDFQLVMLGASCDEDIRSRR
jgi:hypothetical protein